MDTASQDQQSTSGTEQHLPVGTARERGKDRGHTIGSYNVQFPNLEAHPS